MVCCSGCDFNAVLYRVGHNFSGMSICTHSLRVSVVGTVIVAMEVGIADRS